MKTVEQTVSGILSAVSLARSLVMKMETWLVTLTTGTSKM
jgi:hypothetical protein